MNYTLEQAMDILDDEVELNFDFISSFAFGAYTALKRMLSETVLENVVILDNYEGTWKCVDRMISDGNKFFRYPRVFYLMRSREYGNEVGCVIVDKDRNVIVDDCEYGFADFIDCFNERIEIIRLAFSSIGFESDVYSDDIVFYGECNSMRFSSYQEAEEWLEGVVFEDPEKSDCVERILHPERF